jgi:hypothetical protein
MCICIIIIEDFLRWVSKEIVLKNLINKKWKTECWMCMCNILILMQFFCVFEIINKSLVKRAMMDDKFVWVYLLSVLLVKPENAGAWNEIWFNKCKRDAEFRYKTKLNSIFYCLTWYFVRRRLIKSKFIISVHSKLKPKWLIIIHTTYKSYTLILTHTILQ